MTEKERGWYGFWLIVFICALAGAIGGSMAEVRPVFILVALVWSAISAVGMIYNRGTRWD